MSASAVSRSSPTYQFGSDTNIGRRETNEDSLLCARLTTPTGPDGLLLIVSDGVGGGKAGEVASRMTVDSLQRELEDRLARETPPADRRGWIDAAIRALDVRVRAAAAAAPEHADMGATVALLWLEGAQAWWGQAGDSRIYRLRADKLEQITQDQSPVGRLRAEGQISEAEARKHPYRHVIDQCLGGGGGPVQPEVGHFEVQWGDVFLLCSDGVTDGLWDREIGEELRAGVQGKSPAEVAHALVERANAASGKDNITAIVARAENVGPPPARTGWRRLFRL